VRRQADAYSEKIVVDTRLLWDERQRLIDDIRQLADDVLNTAEDALERVSMPQMLSEETEEDTTVSENGPPTEPVELPPPEIELDVLEGGAAADDDDRDEDTA